MKEEEPDIDIAGRLMEGRTGFSSTERDAIFDDVFADVSAQQAAEAAESRRPWWVSLLAWAAVVALVAVPVVLFTQRSDEAEFTARGAEGANLELRCADAECAVGETLLFELSGAERGYFAAFARSRDGTIVWYFPETEDGRSIAVEDGLVKRSVRLGDEHAPGEWTVYALLSETPMTRAEVRDSLDEHGELTAMDVDLLMRTLDVK